MPVISSRNGGSPDVFKAAVVAAAGADLHGARAARPDGPVTEAAGPAHSASSNSLEMLTCTHRWWCGVVAGASTRWDSVQPSRRSNGVEVSIKSVAGGCALAHAARAGGVGSGQLIIATTMLPGAAPSHAGTGRPQHHQIGPTRL